MKRKISKLLIFIVVLFFVIQSVNIVKADDYHHNNSYKYHKHHKHDYDDRDDWDDYYDGDYDHDKYKWKGDYKSKSNKQFLNKIVQPSYWNIWTRTTNISSNENLPVKETKEIPFELNEKTENLLILPANGQLLVSGEKMAKFLNLKYKFYNQSRILEISNNKEELIVRAGSNAAYENMIKTPMPVTAIYYEKTVFLPVSVIANAFGYSVNWNEKKETISLQPFNERREKDESKQ